MSEFPKASLASTDREREKNQEEGRRARQEQSEAYQERLEEKRQAVHQDANAKK